ncbi:hypothetical protein [Actinoallomurus iriomotensis]|uniref:hypothetical protein n=1 Tax=Actinoallomurus iriomotensis TaxID=478107 RepID=UPI002553D61B|nr:hypothetical protein [Actinoallomurus iriomotensis]
MSDGQRIPDGRRLSAGHASLAFGVSSPKPGDLYALAISGGITVRPHEGRTIVFGRNRPEVHVCIGENDPRVSRNHGLLTCRDRSWWVRTTGRLPVRFPDARLLFAGDEPIPLAEGYTPLFVRGASGREHLLELYVAGPDEQQPTSRHGDPTQPPRTWRLSPTERLILVVLAQRYLFHAPNPQPLAWQQAYEHLNDLQPDAGWTAKKVAHKVTAVRTRLSKSGVAGLTREEVGEPVGNKLNENLIHELMESTTLVPRDLVLLDDYESAITEHIDPTMDE